MNLSFRLTGLAITAAIIFAIMPEVTAQGWGDYDRGYDPRPTPPYGAPPPPPPGGPGQSPYEQQQPGYGQPYGQQGYGPGGPRPQTSVNPNPRCRDLELQLTGGPNGGAQDQLPHIDADMRQMDMQYHRAQADAERADCYEDMFLFGRSLKRNPRCIDLDQQVQTAKGRLAQLKAQRDALVRGSAPQGRREDVIAELARNRCGENYAREYDTQRNRNRNSSIFSFFTDEEPDDTSRYTPPPSYSTSTYRTLCVRLCDGLYFPVSSATTENHFQEDEAKCHSQCAAPAELFTHRSDQDVEQMVSLNGQPYSAMPNAFRNRKVYIRGCSCNQNEYSVEEIAKSEEALKHQPQSKRADASGSRKTADALTTQHSLSKTATPPDPHSVAPEPPSAQESQGADTAH